MDVGKDREGGEREGMWSVGWRWKKERKGVKEVEGRGWWTKGSKNYEGGGR